MVEASWEKPKTAVTVKTPNRARFALVGLALLGVMIFLILSGTLSTGRYFTTINDLMARTDLTGKTVKVTGAVIGTTIRFDADTKTIYFTMAHITDDATELANEGGLAKALHEAVINPNAKRLQVQVPNQAMPDLLKDEAQAIVTGKINANGVFVADELLLKCPSKYAADVPNQVSGQ
jgi:cytochrome c-type biogenesis protein CcmE